MSGHEEPGYVDRFVGACLKVLAGAFALYVAVQVVQSVMWPVIIIVGSAALIWLVVVVIRTLHERW
ncbi:hypothetical protein [Nocardia bovistercoris]|uniref:Uncharacterized protein n=1 Tax=Nocardia bovistercoris TaxID=2785916 RepID=A0A931IGS6_9NOCA|nr:hypothetical protein [Nocardia bovistercoris]MBH0779388.1 hypothetical protein [Nocardia bovistercoris]